ncbi:MAG TPA: nuclear transport factor 2 family protein [Candidatus Angelobacter sp.]|nr:nuclear transport factor 2 family protein [Candidatus Angelobacter sp.]
MPRSIALSLFLLLPLAAARFAVAEEVHLDSCDGLPVVEVTVTGAKAAKTKMRFLVDTAATSMLNSKSFAHGDPTRVFVTSWSGTVQAKSRSVALPELVIGEHRLTDLHLPAVDLSAIGHACGKTIDGILGVDLLSRLGVTLDLKNHTAELVADSKTAEAILAELHQQLVGCEEAFNRADEPAFTECLDPQVVTFTFGGDFYGRDAVMAYYRQKYFQVQPHAFLTMVPRAHHLIGDAVWVEYDLKIVLPQQVITARGTALCRKSDGRWRIVHMNHSSPLPAPLQAQTKSATQP